MKEKFGRCDILVNNAGRTRAGNFLELPDDAFFDGFALKYHAAMRLTRLFWPMLKASQGHIVNIVGGAARSPEPEFTIGSSVNAALANARRDCPSSACATASTSTSSIPATPVPSGRRSCWRSARRRPARPVEELRAAALARTGIRRVGEVEDVAALALFLCSERARHIQGTAIAVDGGATVGYY